MLEFTVFCGVTLGLLLLIKPVTRLLGMTGLVGMAALISLWLLFVVSTEYVPTKEEVRDDLDGLGSVIHSLFNWCFGILYGGAALITCWRAHRDLVQRNRA